MGHHSITSAAKYTVNSLSKENVSSSSPLGKSQVTGIWLGHEL